MFYSSMISGTLISISSISWLMIWIGLEINLLSIMPLLKNNKNIYSSEATIKYFIVQAMASAIFLFSICLLSNLKIMNFYSNFFIIIILNSAILLKLGAAPFHAWFPEIISGLNWNMIFIMSTWQKIAPMILISYTMNSSLFFSMVMILSSMISGFQGLNQTMLQKIIAYSSINHVSWMIACIMNSLSIWILYFFIYFLINLNIMMIFNLFNISHYIQLNKLFNSNKKLKFFFMMNFLSLGGLPPFLGFLPKWMTIYFMVKNNYYFTTYMMIIFSLFLLYMYLQITFSSLSMNSEESIIFSMKNYLFKPMLFNLLINFGLIFCFFMYSMF
uniref:NADH-ubiquinone oxidoreductase chain 2 n=1 Tax=Curculionidae sp. 7 AH-2016 TaxID=1903833 RepID=A0A343C4L4_9CUCU|nr:NADH dehydrogenase subunit 2 [Curculionidae sp. 7 AH-2016]